MLLCLPIGACTPRAGEPPSGATGSEGYPSGPYGYATGSTIADLSFTGKEDPRGPSGTAAYGLLPMQTFSFDELRSDPTVRLIWMTGVSGWCVPCSTEQPSVAQAQAEYSSSGLKVIELIEQGGSPGVPATEADLDGWATVHQLHLLVGLDQAAWMAQYADPASFPVSILIGVPDMTIRYIGVGASDLTPTIRGLLQ
jgi:hypothetical protein